MLIRPATLTDLPTIVEIYNAAIPGRLATADTEPVTVASRVTWFHSHAPDSRPLWVLESSGELLGWLSLNSFYGRPAYQRTVEVSLYLAPRAQGRGLGLRLLQHAIQAAPSLGLTTLLAFIFSHNQPSLALFRRCGFHPWGELPDVAELDEQAVSLSILGLRITT